MDQKINHRADRAAATEKEIVPENRSHLVHRAGDASTTLFPGWGPKF